MNDFTKDELQELKWMLCEVGKGVQPLCYKVQSLIDNYCDHKEREIYEWVSKCIQCGMKWGDETQ